MLRFGISCCCLFIGCLVGWFVVVILNEIQWEKGPTQSMLNFLGQVFVLTWWYNQSCEPNSFFDVLSISIFFHEYYIGPDIGGGGAFCTNTVIFQEHKSFLEVLIIYSFFSSTPSSHIPQSHIAHAIPLPGRFLCPQLGPVSFFPSGESQVCNHSLIAFSNGSL